jgi:2,4-dienoyl-CoA reductase-like NADH-dependent reductase (Old Yellow Enzyme family)
MIRTIFDPLQLPSGVTAPNRIAMAPMTTWSGNADGTISDAELRYLARRARGLGMTITAACYTQPEGMAFPGQWGCHDDAMIPSLRAAADAIHAGGGLAVLQIHHGGRMCPSALTPGGPWSASAVPAERPGSPVPRAMTEAEIEQAITAFAAATRRAVQAGYDGVEIHGANTYLVQQFFSPHSNRRNDAWGGTLQRRMRFPLLLAQAVLAAARDVSADRPFAVGYRISPEEIEEPGITIDDTLHLASMLAELKLDWLHVSVRDYRAPSLRDPADPVVPTERIRARVSARLPVIGVGSLATHADAEGMLADGCAMAALGRILLMEPDWMEKISTRRDAEVRRQLPRSGGAALLDLPDTMYTMLLGRTGWLPVSEGDETTVS